MATTVEELRSAPKYNPAQRAKNPYSRGSRYAQMYDTNPYEAMKAGRQRTFWDKLANAWGFRSSYDTAMESYDLASAEYDAQIAQLKGEDEYNTPSAMAERMRAAGMNPDLQGIGDVAGAGEFAQEQTTPEIKADENLQKIGEFGNGLIQCIMTGVGFTKEMLNLKGIRAGVEGAELENSNKLTDFVDKFIGTTIGTIQKDKDTGDSAGNEWNQLIENAKSYANDNFKSTKLRNAFQSRIKQLVNSANTDGIKFDKWREAYEKRNEFAKVYGSRYANSENYYDITGVISTLQPVIDALDNYTVKILEAGNAKSDEEKAGSKYKTSYYQGLDAEKASEATNEQNEMTIQEAGLRAAMKEPYSQVMRDLSEKAKKGDVLSAVLQMILPGLMTKYFGM